jgi:hypothetical protein|tara:strand:+ start:397 stop:666 length:270 start_codon:yes stop_codon:yes gene_type:complete
MPEYKTVNITHQLNVKHNWIAKDWNGSWYAFQRKPNLVDDMWDVKDGLVSCISEPIRFYTPIVTETMDDGIDWRTSLEEIDKIPVEEKK